MNTKLTKTLVIIGFFLLIPTILQNVVALDDPDYVEVIDAGYYIYFYDDLTKGDVIDVEFEVIAGGNLDIDFFIADETNYLMWHNGMEALVYGLRERYRTAAITFTVPKTDTYYVIFSNTFSVITSKTVEINLDFRSGFLSLISSPIAIIIIIGIIAIVIVLIVRAARKKTSVSPNVSSPTIPPTALSPNSTCTVC